MDVLSRREFLRVSGLTLAATVAAACAPVAPPAEPTTAPAEAPTSAPAAPTAAPEPVSRYSDAPMLADLVASGDLPPVEERLPLNPLVLSNMDGSIGKYGGTVRRGMKGLADSAGPEKMRRETLVYYDADLTFRANVADGWDVSEDATEYVFHLREGKKWSDGTPFDAEGIRFWYEDELLNEIITPAINRDWTTGPEKTVMQLEFPDDYTVVVTFADPYPLFVYQVCENQIWTPGHYMSQFHMDLTHDPEALDMAVTDAGFETWDQLYADRNAWHLNPDLPQIGPWISKTSMAEDLFIMERNPYFYQVDPDGQQLPYLDQMNHRRFETPDVFNMWILNGEIDFQYRHVAVSDFTLFKESESKGDYTVQLGADDGTMCLSLNQTCPDPKLRQFFQNRAVRFALSYAINRTEINELIYDGMTTPRQYSPSSASPQFYAELSNAYLEYDPDKANQILDEAGFADRSEAGFRVYPDGSGEEVAFTLEGMNQAASDLYEMVTRYLNDVGLKASFQIYERSLVYEHIDANTLEGAVEKASRAVLPLADPSFFLDIAGHKLFGIAWRHWYYNPDNPVAEAPLKGTISTPCGICGTRST